MVDFVLSEEQLMLQELAREFALKEIKPNAEKCFPEGRSPLGNPDLGKWFPEGRYLPG